MSQFKRGLRQRSRGFTLVEVMIATALTLLLMAVVVQVFAIIGKATADTREIIQITDRLRTAKLTLQSDLGNLTAPMLPPLKPEMGQGYFEYVEGPAGPVMLGSVIARNIDESDSGGNPTPDTTVGDPDDILMFTTRNEEHPFYGRYRDFVTHGGVTTLVDSTTTSQFAEICWFVRGNSLYRRVLLVKPEVSFVDATRTKSLLSTDPTDPAKSYDISYYDKFDISAHQVGGQYDITLGAGPPMLVANSLTDLTLRENRYGHQPWSYPYDTRFWGALGLPTLRECTFYTNMISTQNPAVARWPFPLFDPAVTPNLWGQPVTNPGVPVSPYGLTTGPLIVPYPTVSPTSYQPNTTVNSTSPTINLSLAPGQYYDAWSNPFPWQQVNPTNGAIYAFSGTYQPTGPTSTSANQSYDGSTRISDDIILTNVLSFDVKAWDPTAPIISDTLVDLTKPSLPVPTTAAVYMPGDVGYTQLMTTWAKGAADPAAFLLTVQQHTVGRGAYVDLNYLASVSSGYSATAPAPNMYQALTRLSNFAGPGLATNASGLGSLYDTGSFTYEDDGLDQNADGIIDNYTNGFDDNGVGGVDDVTEMEGPVPYPVPLKGIQIKIRVFEPDSRQIREVTITEDFLWE